MKNENLNYCAVCNSSQNHVEYMLDFRNILRCEKCGLVFTKFHNIETFCQANTNWNTPDLLKPHIYLLPEHRREAAKRLKFLLKFCKGKKLIEFGTNTGTFAYVASKAGFDVTGVNHFRHFIWTNIKQVIKSNNILLTSGLDSMLKDKIKISPSEEIFIFNSLKVQFCRFELLVKKFLSLSVLPYANWIEKNSMGDVLQVVATHKD